MNIASQHKSNSVFPNWFAQQQELAWKQFQALPVPTRHDELWRFSNLKSLDLSTWQEASAPTDRDDLLALSQGI